MSDVDVIPSIINTRAAASAAAAAAFPDIDAASVAALIVSPDKIVTMRFIV